MKTLLGLLLVFGLFLGSVSIVSAYVSVGGYYRSNGTYVQPYVRSSPNAFKYDNYSYSGGSLYNPSYYSSLRNYSPSWYSPSWYTDSSYYSGKSLYNSYQSLYGY